MQTIGIYSGHDGFVGELQQLCPTLQFSADESERKNCRIAVVDTDSHAVLSAPAGKNLVRIVLCDGSRPQQRRHGEIRVFRKEFLAAPDDYLLFAIELADAAVHAARLEQEATYLNEIHDMMSMVEADAVSERITTMVLRLLGVERGTLFLH